MDYTRDFQTAIQTFTLTDLPASTPPKADFFLTTGLEGWRTGLPELHFADRTLRRAYPLGTHLSFKVSRGSPGSEEGDVWGQRRPERCHVVIGEATHALGVESWMDFPLSARPSTLSARIERLRVYSPELDDTFSVLVWLPPQAGEGGRRFPAVYLHDGQNIFDRATSFAGRTWRADEAALNLAEAGLPCILVAVEVRPLHRAEDYCTFTLAANHFLSSAAAYQAFLAETLRPLIDARFPTFPGAPHTAQAGSSLGGLASLSGGLSRPEVWGGIGAFSPSLWAQDWAIFGWTAGRSAPASRVYLDTGDHEGEFAADAAMMVNQTRWYVAQLRGAVKDVRLEVGAGHWHNEAAWAARLPGFLKWWLEGIGTGK